MSLVNSSAWCNAVVTNRTWIPPDLTVLRWDNCTTPSLWLELFYRTMFPDGGQYPLQITAAVLREGYREYWQQRNMSEPAGWELQSWFLENRWKCNSTGENGLDVYLERHARTSCLDKFCKRLPWQGNSDQAGRGMIACYTIQAILVTIYVSILLSTRFPPSRPNPNPPSRSAPLAKFLHRTRESAQESLREFLDASLIFSLAMVLASIVSSSLTLFAVRDQSATVPDPYALARTSLQVPLQSSVLFSTFAALFTLFPAIALHSSAPASLRRKKWRTFLWALLGALTLAMFALSRVAADQALAFMSTTQNPTWRDPDGQMTFEYYCLERSYSASVKLSILIFFVAACASGVIYFLMLPVWALHTVQDTPIAQKLRDAWSVVAAVLATLTMWAAFATFYFFRQRIGERSGGTNKDHAWTFGQVVAISTFAPVVIQFAMVWGKGAERALTGSMSVRYRAERVGGGPGEKVTYRSLEAEGGDDS